MKLSLHKFMCWDELELEIPINQITLIKADSGVGKTTLFKAIDCTQRGTEDRRFWDNSPKCGG